MRMCIWLLANFILTVCKAGCPTSKKDWESESKSCKNQQVYLCLIDIGSAENTTKEICHPKRLIDDNSCPVLHNETIFYVKCSGERCPNTPYPIAELYHYPICFGGENIGSEGSNTSGEYSIPQNRSSNFTNYLTTDEKTTVSSYKGNSAVYRNKKEIFYLILGTTLALIVALNVCVITFYCIRKRRRRQQKTSADELQPVSIAVMSRIYDHTNVNPCNNTSTTNTSNTEENNVYNIGENGDIYNHLQNRRVCLDQPILYDSD